MGLTKRHMEEIEARGYEETDKVVCARCFGDYYLQRKIKNEGECGTCSFCGANRHVLPLERILEEIVKAIKFYYTHAENKLIWDSEDERWFGGTPVDVYDVVYDNVSYELNIENEALKQELIDKIKVGLLVGSDRGKSKVYRHLRQWEKFTHIVNQPEYNKLSSDQIVKLCQIHRSDSLTAIMEGIMETILTCCKKFRAFKYLNDTIPIYRCVSHLENFEHIPGLFRFPAFLVGTAPSKYVEDNRMSEKGETVFYGATDVLTSLIECDQKNKKKFWVGCFKTNRRFRILDLSQLDDKLCPSWLEVDKHELRDAYYFLRAFESEIVKYAGDYKPTQIFAKFIQRRFGVDGIKYRSAKMLGKDISDNNHACYALFVTTWDCLDIDEKTDRNKAQLIMQASPKSYTKKEMKQMLQNILHMIVAFVI